MSKPKPKNECPACSRAVGDDGICYHCIKNRMYVAAFRMLYQQDRMEKNSLTRFVRAIVRSSQGHITRKAMREWHALKHVPDDIPDGVDELVDVPIEGAPVAPATALAEVA